MFILKVVQYVKVLACRAREAPHRKSLDKLIFHSMLTLGCVIKAVFVPRLLTGL